MGEMIRTGILMGLGATALLDLWAVFLWAVAGFPTPNWAMVGRWFWHAGHGHVFHADIAQASEITSERALGWIAHYAVGAVYGLAFVLIVGPDWLAAPSYLPALAFGLATVAAGWFLLQPGMGLGVAASKTPNPGTARALNLAGHTVFGTGLWAVALLVG
ncbi:MAG: DUF2938 domain-containing protein [Pseudomonadota bacterium]